MQLKFKKLHPDAILPKYAKEGDAGLDLTAISSFYSNIDEVYEYETGLAVEIPDGYVGLIFPRSSIYRTSMQLNNAVGVIDSKYRGPIILKFNLRAQKNHEYLKVGGRIGQLIVIPYPKIEPEFVDELDTTNDRGGGHGSTGA